MEITNLSWNENLSKRFNNPLLPRSIRGLIVGKSGCGKTTLLLNLLLNPLPDDKILNLSKLKAFAGEKINVSEKLKFP